MIRHDRIINSLIHGDMVHKVAAERNVGLTEARLIISRMSFKEYRALEEASADIVPPSGKPLSPGNVAQSTASATTPGQQSQPATTSPTAVKQPPADPRGTLVKNPQTGKMEWMKPSTPAQPGQSVQPAAQAAGTLQAQAMSETNELARMKQLAGIKEDGSCGGTSAGAIAISPTSMGAMKRRQPTDEKLKKEYTPKEAAKTIVGDTKPNQASGELSATLAVNGKRTASRINNGIKR